MVEPPIVNGIKAAIAAGLLLGGAGLAAKFQAEQQQFLVRPAIKAGSWYEKDPLRLTTQTKSLLQAVDEVGATRAGALVSENAPAGEPLDALICPHAAYRYSGIAAAHAYSLLSARRQKINRVFILGPLHHERVHGVIVPAYQSFATPAGDLPLDTTTIDQLAACRLFQKNNQAQAAEYSIEMQLPFIKQAMGDVKIVPLYVGKLNDRAEIEYVADILKRFIAAGDLLVVSSDFTHYGAQYNYVPFTTDVQPNIRKLDATAYDALRRRDLDAFLKYKSETHNTICGFYPLCVLMATLPKDCHATLLDYYTSQDLPSGNGASPEGAGDKSWSVSYLAVAFTGGNTQRPLAQRKSSGVMSQR